MDKELLIQNLKALKVEDRSVYGEPFNDGKRNFAIDECIEIVRQHTDWYPIETEPTDGDQYLVTDGNCVIMAEHPNEERIEHDITSCGIEEVTHWMRLPEPPK